MRVTTWHSTDYWGSRAPGSQTSRSPQTAWSSRSRCAAGGSPALLRPGGRRSPRPLFAALAPPRSRGPAPLPRVRPAADRCPDCGVRVEAVPFAHPRARHTRDFEDFTAFLGQQLAKTPIASLLRVGWDTVGAIVERVVCDHLDERRLCGLVQIGVDEVSSAAASATSPASPTTARARSAGCARAATPPPAGLRARRCACLPGAEPAPSPDDRGLPRLPIDGMSRDILSSAAEDLGVDVKDGAW
jgi:hypothetical protein